MIGVTALAADTEDEARYQSRAGALSMVLLRSGRLQEIPTPEQAAAYPYSPAELDLIRAMGTTEVVGTADQVADGPGRAGRPVRGQGDADLHQGARPGRQAPVDGTDRRRLRAAGPGRRLTAEPVPVRPGSASCVCRSDDAGTCRAMAKDLSSTKERKKLSKSSFALPGKRKYPIPDKAHARNALARVAQFGSKDEKRRSGPR